MSNKLANKFRKSLKIAVDTLIEVSNADISPSIKIRARDTIIEIKRILEENNS